MLRNVLDITYINLLFVLFNLNCSVPLTPSPSYTRWCTVVQIDHVSEHVPWCFRENIRYMDTCGMFSTLIPPYVRCSITGTALGEHRQCVTSPVAESDPNWWETNPMLKAAKFLRSWVLFLYSFVSNQKIISAYLRTFHNLITLAISEWSKFIPQLLGRRVSTTFAKPVPDSPAAGCSTAHDYGRGS